MIIVSSCAVTRNSGDLKYLNVQIFQVLDSDDALAMDNNFNVVKLITAGEVYYDGLNVKGVFILVDTYAYYSKDGRYRVIPVYVRYKEYKQYSRIDNYGF